jgi:hypothetical protein
MSRDAPNARARPPLRAGNESGPIDSEARPDPAPPGSGSKALHGQPAGAARSPSQSRLRASIELAKPALATRIADQRPAHRMVCARVTGDAMKRDVAASRPRPPEPTPCLYPAPPAPTTARGLNSNRPRSSVAPKGSMRMPRHRDWRIKPSRAGSSAQPLRKGDVPLLHSKVMGEQPQQKTPAGARLGCATDGGERARC